MKILDCESIDSMYASLEMITGITKNELIAFFNEFDLEGYFEKHPDFYGYAQDLFQVKLEKMAKTNLQFDSTTWFHLTRTYKENNFSQGILPLGENIEFIWDFLFRIQEGHLSKEKWVKFKTYFEKESQNNYADLYRMKVRNPIHWGPYAMLVKEIAFVTDEVRNHDYLDAPEIVEDICFTFSDKYNFDLLRSFKSNTYPCIVKFIFQEARPKHLGTVVNFLYHKHHNMELSIHCNTCFDGEGKGVPKESILKIEYV